MQSTLFILFLTDLEAMHLQPAVFYNGTITFAKNFIHNVLFFFHTVIYKPETMLSEMAE